MAVPRNRYTAMSDDNSQYIARAPRHAATPEHRLVVTFHHAPGERRADPGSAVAVELVNLSRSGLQCRSPKALFSGDRVVFEFMDPESDLRLRQEAVVRWQHGEDDQSWLAGCPFSEELSWEVLGEFFLSDVLSSEVISPGAS